MRDAIPHQHHHLALERAVLPARVQLETGTADGDHHVAALPGVAAAVREHDVAVAGQLARQFQVLYRPGAVLQRLQLVESLAGLDRAPIHLVYGLPEDVRRRLRVAHQRQLSRQREQPLPHTETRTRRRTVVLYVEIVRVLARLQFPLWNT